MNIKEEFSLQDISILIVEDSPTQAILSQSRIVSALEMCSPIIVPEFCVVTTIKEAESKNDDYDLIILDLTLPDANTYDSVSAILTKFNRPIMVMSGTEDFTTVTQCGKMGAISFVGKSMIASDDKCFEFVVSCAVGYALRHRLIREKNQEIKSRLLRDLKKLQPDIYEK